MVAHPSTIEGTPGGAGGDGGAAKATAATTVISGSAGATADASGGNGGNFGYPTGLPPLLRERWERRSGNGCRDGSFGKRERYCFRFGDWAVLAPLETTGEATAAAPTPAARPRLAASAMHRRPRTPPAARERTVSTGLLLPEATPLRRPMRLRQAAGRRLPRRSRRRVLPYLFGNSETAQAASNAETVNGAEAQALSTAEGVPGSSEFSFGSISASSTAKTSFAGVTTTATAAAASQDGTVTETTDAIAQGGSSQIFVAPDLSSYHLDRPS